MANLPYTLRELKAEMRKINAPKLKQSEINLESNDNKEYVVTARPIMIFENILLVNFYKIREWRDGEKKGPLKEPKFEFRIFFTKNEFYTQKVSEETGMLRWSNSKMENLLDTSWGGYRGIEKVGYADNISNEMGSKFFGTKLNLIEAIEKFQNDYRMTELLEKRRKTTQKIEDAMKNIKPLPTDIDNWARNVPFKFSRYIFYKRNGKIINGQCSVCGKDVILQKATHNEKGTCPHCKQEVTLKAKGKSTKISDSSKMAVIQGVNDGVFVREFHITRTYFIYSGTGRRLILQPEVMQYETKRVLITSTKETAFEQTNDYRSQYTPVWREIKDFNMRSYNYYGAAGPICCHLYTRNLDTELNATIWKYSQIRTFAKKVGEIPVLMYLDKYKRYPFIEYLVKLRLYRITEQFINNHEGSDILQPYSKKPSEILNIKPLDISIIQKHDCTIKETELLKQMKIQGTNVDDEIVRWITENKVETYYLKEIIKHVTITKLKNYASKQVEESPKIIKDFLITMRDYLEAAKSLGYDLKQDQVLLPKDLKKAHDNAIISVKVKKDEAYRAAVERFGKEAEIKYGYKDKGLKMMAPISMEEIIREGQELIHCVGAYVKIVAEGKTTILFIRKEDEPEKPYYTVEYRNGDIVQCRGFKNEDPTKEIEKFIEKWKAEIKKRKIKANKEALTQTTSEMPMAMGG